MPSADIFRLLLTAPSADEANQFVSILRSANYTVDAKLATQEHELQALLARDWDLILALESHTLLTPKLVRQNLLRAECQTPLIVVSELDNQPSVIDGLRLGAAAVVARDHDQQLLLEVERSQQQALALRHLASAKSQLQQLQRQHHALLNSWPSPLLVVVEGIVRLCNGAAARMLDSEPSALLELPILDRLDARSRNALRGRLLAADDPAEPLDIEHLNFVTASGSVVTRRVTVASVWFGGERGLQITVEARLRRDAGSSAQRRPELSERPAQMIAAVERGLRQSVERGRCGAIIKLQIVEYPQLLERLGSHATAQLIEQFIKRIGDSAADAAELIICGPGSVTLTLVDCEQDYALLRANALWAVANGEQFGAQPLTVQVGATLLDGRSHTADEAIALCNEALLLSADRAAAAILPALEVPPSTSDTRLEQLIEQRQLTIQYRPISALTGAARQLFSSELSASANGRDLAVLIDGIQAGSEKQRLDHWLIISALAELQRAGDTATTLLLPLSAASVTDSRFIPWLKAQLRSHPLNRDRLTIVLRESDIIRHIELMTAAAGQLAELKISLAISHFGVALNPLETLAVVHPSLLILDRQISAALAGDNASDALALVEASNELNIPTVVEGIDSAQLLPLFWRAGVGYISGAYVGEPSASLGG